MRPNAHDFLKRQRKYLASQPFPLSKKAKEVLKLQQNILNELAVAYKIIIQETVNRDSRLSSKKLVTCVHHAMYYQIEQYITLAQVYSEPPQSFWHDLCQLYGIAEHFELTSLQIKNVIDPFQRKSSPESLFTLACLLSLANLHSYKNSEAGKIANYLKKENHLTNLTSVLPKDCEYTFYINLALRKPVRLMKVNEISISSKNRYIDATVLLNELKKFGNSKIRDDDKISHTINKSLSIRLLNKLTSKPVRVSKRVFPAKDRLHLVIGMHDVIEILQTGHIIPKNNSGSAVTKSNIELTLVNNLIESRYINDHHKECETRSDAWNWLNSGNLDSEQNECAAAQNEPENEKVNLKPAVQTWDISNASKGGYCLSSNNTSDYQSQVGDIVLMRLEDKHNDEWRLGVIRWMQSLTTQGVKMGIETLHGSLVISTHQVSSHSVDIENIIQITENTERETNKTIILPPNAAENGDHFVVRINKGELTITCQHMLEKTISFARFYYSEMPALASGEQD